MRTLFVHHCRRCGREFVTGNKRRLYCSEECRRHFQDERRIVERKAEAGRKSEALRKPVGRAVCPFVRLARLFPDLGECCAGCMVCFQEEDPGGE